MRMASYEEYKDRLRELLLKMDNSPADIGMPMLDAFVNDYEASLYNEVGRLTRQLHESLKNFETEERILDLAKENIPGAKERLRYVFTVSEQAAQNVLSIIEKSMPVLLSIGDKATVLRHECQEMDGPDYSLGGLSSFRESVRIFLEDAKRDSGLLHGHLTEILMAQEYQDITGQIIKKVIDLVQDIEDSLVKIIKMTGRGRLQDEVKPADDKAQGHRIPALDDGHERVSGQDDVDQLLDSLGF